MKGLLIKDFQIIMQQKRYVTMLLLISVFMMLAVGDPTFIIGYITFLLSMLVTGTISYDDLDNGFSFLFTLPVTRKQYALEKYILSLLVSGGAWVLANIGVGLVKGFFMEGYYFQEEMLGSVIMFVLCMVMQAIMIPLYMKFGAEKSRWVLMIMVGGITAILLLIGQFGGILPEQVNEMIVGISTAIEKLGMLGVAMLALLVGIVGMAISCIISGRIMEKKQF